MSPPLPPLPRIRLPRIWPAHVKLAFLCAVALAHRGIVFVRAWCENSPVVRVRLAGRLVAAEIRAGLLERENRLLRSRLSRVPAERRPHHTPEERLEILAIKSETGWTARKLAERLVLAPSTIASWLHRIDDEGPAALLRMPEPVNRFPDFVRQLVQHLRTSCPAMGKTRIAEFLARAGLHLAPTTVQRFLRAKSGAKPRPPKPNSPPVMQAKQMKAAGRTIVALRPNHVWGIDNSTLPTALGFWVPWFPGAMIPVWPFCFWLSAVVDHFSRRVLAVGVFINEPTAAEICQLLDRARARAGSAPKYTVTDHGTQFQQMFRDWCARHHVKPRYGAIGKCGSIAIVERFWRSMKGEAFGPGRALLPLAPTLVAELARGYADWYNDHRAHQGLLGRTPSEVFCELAVPAHRRPRLEPRARYPARAPSAAPRVPVRGRRGVKIRLVLRHPPGLPHLPIVELRSAA